MKRLVTALLAAALAIAICSADEGPSDEEKRIWAESEDRLVLHYHDWRDWQALEPIYADLQKQDRFFGKENKHAYVDYRVFGMPAVLSEDAWKSLAQKAVRDPEILWIQESATNYVHWFDERKPEIAIARTGGRTLLELNDLIRWEYEPDEPRSGRLHFELPGKNDFEQPATAPEPDPE